MAMEEEITELFPWKTNLDDLFRTGNLYVNKKGEVASIIGLANKSMIDDDPIKVMVIYRKDDNPEVRASTLLQFTRDYVPKTKEFEIWLGWYRATGNDMPAHIVGKQVARTFNEAVELFYKEQNALDSLWYYEGRWELKGYGPFYTNGDDAAAP